ncbi:acyl-CoA dehydrogenase family protein [Leptospira alstonii]|uniref:Acyl-CoA dehydrogenase, C-terminal domain protein n=2 Tax=Leptospira alstonii TaxID=28452 RepID=M6D2M6_9LEPT|nr:acyl-CoA dehydrogenase family protein [Leptospira alstonii]EMJ95433.1 acyl-CoA dehydrogenase, C-terminal domain protein [Leptospira alstonii serovar Sichuan str. 79601]EQA80115.1 acyl-CoA dehydrogenase, C-terminal domain protein [Leptospira alstonii serovar Pingchang str. 80-412]
MDLLNPKKTEFKHLDEKSGNIMKRTIAFFEKKGKNKLKEDDRNQTWYADFLEFQKQEKIFATLMTPAGYGESDSRWDTTRICDFNEIAGFYGLCYWYTWQVSMLGLGPIWNSKNEEIKHKTAKLLLDGEIFAFGLSEKEHGADLISSDMSLENKGDGNYVANGRKYYIGNSNKAAIVSTFGKMKDTGNYVFFAADSGHKNYELIQNVVNSQSYVGEYALKDYPIAEKDILSKDREAWDASLSTIAICKYNLGWASIGICTHSFYEALNHASKRRLFNRNVTDFSQIKQMFVDAYCRLFSMKLFASRAKDYMRSASATDRRYLLFNPMVKMKVTMQGEEVINLLWDVIAAKGFEKNMYFEMAAKDIRGLPKLEGTAHVNMALIIKFMNNYFFDPNSALPVIPKINEFKNDDFLFNQGTTTKGFEKITFRDYDEVYASVDLPNVKIFRKQISVLKEFLKSTPPDSKQSKDLDFMLILGELFTLVAYGQLLIENASIEKVENDLLSQIFDFMVRDFSKYALQLYSKRSSTKEQMEKCLAMIFKPSEDEELFNRVCAKVYSYKDAYEMAP